MEPIGKKELWSFVAKCKHSRKVTNTLIRKDEGHKVSDYLDLARKVAELQFRNRDYVLLFRGQRNDYRTSQKEATTLRPSLFRSDNIAPGDDGWNAYIEKQFSRLRCAEQSLVDMYQGDEESSQYLKRHRIIQWALLQHYEVCGTPLLDVTHSLRIAASFASHENTTRAYLYVLGVPNLGGAVTASAEAGLQILRLSSVCPPQAVRPHIQEGYLLGEYPDIPDFDQKRHYKAFEVDFGRRLIAKFNFNPQSFWNQATFPLVQRDALFPDDRDPLFQLSKRVKDSLPKGD